MRILVVEDESELRQAIARYLRGLGHAVDESSNCRLASEAAEIYEHDVAILDRILPDGDSIQMLKQWRAGGKRLPVLFLTARDSVDDRIDGLQSGADDYLVKPFAMEELSARINTIARRISAPLFWPLATMTSKLTRDCEFKPLPSMVWLFLKTTANSKAIFWLTKMNCSSQIPAFGLSNQARPLCFIWAKAIRVLLFANLVQ